MSNKITIIADDREKPSKIPEILSAYDNVDLTIERLKKGDYVLNGRIMIERKSLRDLAASIIDGRVFKQAALIAGSGLNPAFILEGTSKDLKDFNISRQSIQGVLIYISVVLGIPVLRSMSIYETAQLMIYTANQVTEFKAGLVKRSGYYPKKKLKRQMLILQALPGIGRKRAKMLIDRFETIKAAINASEEELGSIEGIGKTTVNKIINVINDPRLKYN